MNTIMDNINGVIFATALFAMTLSTMAAINDLPAGLGLIAVMMITAAVGTLLGIENELRRTHKVTVRENYGTMMRVIAGIWLVSGILLPAFGLHAVWTPALVTLIYGLGTIFAAVSLR